MGYGPHTCWAWASNKQIAILKIEESLQSENFNETTHPIDFNQVIETELETPAIVTLWVWGVKNREYPLCLVLQPDDEWEESERHKTEEGYSERYIRIERSDNLVTMDMDTDSSDCDGPLQTGKTWTCKIENLENGDILTKDEVEFPEIRFPDWELEKSSQRDVFAEAMGY